MIGLDRDYRVVDKLGEGSVRGLEHLRRRQPPSAFYDNFVSVRVKSASPGQGRHQAHRDCDRPKGHLPTQLRLDGGQRRHPGVKGPGQADRARPGNKIDPDDLVGAICFARKKRHSRE